MDSWGGESVMSNPELQDALQQDIAARTAALDIKRSFLVQAPAGSGKTELLTQRFLALLATVDEPEEIVALTFTRKAAGEMVNRILTALEMANRPAPTQPHKKQTYDLACAAVAHAAERGWERTMMPRRLRVQTIDSLCGYITHLAPVGTSLGIQPQLMERPEEAYSKAAGIVIGRLDEQGDVGDALKFLLQRVDSEFGSLYELIQKMLTAREQWKRHLPDGNLDDYRKFLEESLCRFINQRLRKLHDLMPWDICTEMGLLRIMDFAGCNAPEGSPITALKGVKSFPKPDVKNWDIWCGLLELLTTKSDPAWRSAYTKNHGFPPTVPNYKEMKAELGKFVSALKEEKPLLEALCLLRTTPNPCYDGEQWEALKALFVVLPEAVAALQQVFVEQGQVDFSEISSRATEALARAGGGANLFSPPLRHLLVDEFQDTSYSQYRLVELLMSRSSTTEVSTPPTLFVVGDPMQSIYRFREADVGLFLQAGVQMRIGKTTLQELKLKRNFRSRPDLVRWVNDSMISVFPAKDEQDPLTGAVTFNTSVDTREKCEGPIIRAKFYLDTDGCAKKQEAKMVVKLVQRELRRSAMQQAAGESAATTGILVRARTHLPSILLALRTAGIRYQAVEIDQLGERPVVQDLLALTRALAHPLDSVAWCAVLRAPWCGLSLSDLLAVMPTREKGAPRTTIWDNIQNALEAQNGEGGLSPDGRARLQALADRLAPALQQRGRVAMHALVESTWYCIGGPACVTETSAHEEAREYLDLLNSLEESGLTPDFSRLTDSLGKLFAPPDLEADASLQVMTIHKAKGLEFDTVILPGLSRQPRTSTKQLLAWVEGGDPASGDHVLTLLPVQPRGVKNDAMADFFGSINKAKEAFELQRLFYVALTRARERLFLLGTLKPAHIKKFPTGTLCDPHPQSLLKHLWGGALKQLVDKDLKAELQAYGEKTRRELEVAGIFQNEESGGCENDEEGDTDSFGAGDGEGKPDDRIDLISSDPDEDFPQWAEAAMRNMAAGAILQPPLNKCDIRRMPVDSMPVFPKSNEEVTPHGGVLRLAAEDRPPGARATTNDLEGAPESTAASTAFIPRHAASAMRCAGTVAHRMLCRIAADGVDAWPPERVKKGRQQYELILRQLGVAKGKAFDAAVDRIHEALLFACTDPVGRKILGQHTEQGSEDPLTGLVDGEVVNVILDRWFVDEDGVPWVVDYKTSYREGAGGEQFIDGKLDYYRPQLDRYAVLLAAKRGVEPETVRRCLYFPLMKASRVW